VHTHPFSSRILLFGTLALALAGCSAVRERWRPRRTATPAPLVKITRLETRVPKKGELPPVVGYVQEHRVKKGETLLDIARDAGLGFNEIRLANPDVDEWVPPPGREIVVPTRWILPRSHYRGLVINIPEMRLYLFPRHDQPGERVQIRTWAIGVGTDEAPSPVGAFAIRSKDRNPTWYVPDSIYRTMDHPVRVVPPGPDNPMGKYRIRLSKGLYAIHGTNNPWSIGRRTTHGCIRLYPEDIEELYPLVDRSTRGELLYEPVKLGADGDRIYVEVYDDLYGRIRNMQRHAEAEVRKAGLAKRVDPALLRAAVREHSGIPVDVTKR